MTPRWLLLEMFDAALRAVDGRTRVARVLRERHLPDAIVAIAVGKAASAMMLGARDALGARLRRCLLITKDGHVDAALRSWPGTELHESAHPVPDQRSLAAGAALIDALRALRDDEFPLFLVSGGSSSLVESLAEGVSLEDLRELNRRGLAAGWDIGQLNAARARLSTLKRGGIARLLGARAGMALLISDVPGDDPGVIGSGLLGEAPGHADRISRIVVAGAHDAADAAMEAGRNRGLDMRRLQGRIAGDVDLVARQFLEALRDCEGDGLVWAGESTVTLPASPGRGGRNQHLALILARALRANEAMTLLAAGTDGTDGPTGDAGAIVDADSVHRAELAGVDVERALRDFDSGTALEAAEDLVHTGPTGTNVGDLLIGIKRSAANVASGRSDRAPGRVL